MIYYNQLVLRLVNYAIVCQFSIVNLPPAPLWFMIMGPRGRIFFFANIYINIYDVHCVDQRVRSINWKKKWVAQFNQTEFETRCTRWRCVRDRPFQLLLLHAAIMISFMAKHCQPVNCNRSIGWIYDTIANLNSIAFSSSTPASSSSSLSWWLSHNIDGTMPPPPRHQFDRTWPHTLVISSYCWWRPQVQFNLSAECFVSISLLSLYEWPLKKNIYSKTRDRH